MILLYSHLNAKEKSMLASVCAQRLQTKLQKELDAYNTSKLQHSRVVMFATADGEALVVLSLSILQSLLRQPESELVILLVSERLPSTLVKLLKALSSPKPVEHGSVGIAILALLESLASGRQVIQELMETSTLHRLFSISFERADMQAAVLSVWVKHKAIASARISSSRSFAAFSCRCSIISFDPSCLSIGKGLQNTCTSTHASLK